MQGGADHPEAALAIPAPAGTTILAIAHGSYLISRADWPAVMATRRPDVWNVRGTTIELPGGAPGSASWGYLVRRYGPALVYGSRSRSGAIFCQLPDLQFTFDAPAVDTTRSHMLDSSSAHIPGAAGVENIAVMPGALRPAYKECGGTGPYLDPAGDEREAAAQSGENVRRVGDTLFVRGRNGTQVTLVSRPEISDMRITYTYVGTIANGTLHQIAVQGWEHGWTEYVTVASGRRFSTVGEPIMSPDGTRITSAFYALQTCEGTARLEIFRLTDSIPALEFEIEPRDCVAETGWAPHHLRWLSSDTLAFLADSERATDTPMLAVREGNRWRIVPRP